ncbi:unnamed protein product [Closterium sp. NIES-53]
MATTALSTLPPGASSRALMTSGSSNLASKQSVQHLLLPQGARIARLALTAHASGIAASMSTVVTSAAVVEAEGEAQAPEAAQAQVRKGRGKSGGRQRVQRRKGGDGGVEAVGVRTNKLAWLADEGVMLDSERTLARVNRAIARCSSVREALGVVEEMKAKGLNAANEGTYQALITVCRRQRQGERALVVYAAMKQAGMAPGMLTFNALISCCHQAQRFEDAFRLKVLLCEACGQGVCVWVFHKVQVCGARGMLTFNALISCCHQAQRYEDAFRLKVGVFVCVCRRRCRWV